MIQITINALSKIIECNKLTPGATLPRATKPAEFKMGNGVFKRGMFSYSVWRMQRLQNMISNFNEQDQQTLTDWLEQQGQPDILSIDFGPKLKLRGLTAALA